MSKITQEKKKKQAKKLDNSSVEGAETKASGKCLNYGKCCTCVHYPKHKSGHEAQLCSVSKTYVARKAEHSECYKCKFS